MEEMMSITLGHQLEQVAARYPDDEMIKYTDRPYRRTWREFDEEVEEIKKSFFAY